MLWSVLLIGYALLLHLGLYLVPVSWQPEHPGVFSAWIYARIGHAGALPNLLALLLLVLQGTLVNMLALRHRIPETINLFPGLFYVLFASLLPEFLHLSPVLLANTFFLFALTDLFSVYNRQRISGYVFNLGLWIALASLFYPPFLFLILWAFIGLGILRAYDIRERFMVLTGVLTPYLLTALYWYTQGAYTAFVDLQFGQNFAFFQLGAVRWSWTLAMELALVGVLLLVILFQYGAFLSKRVIQEQKQINILYWGLFVAGVSVLFQRGLDLAHLLMLTLPMSYLLAIQFGRLRRNWAEFYHLILVLCALFLQLKPLFNL